MGGGIGRGDDSRILSTRRYMWKTRGIMAETRRINELIFRIKADISRISIKNTGQGICLWLPVSEKKHEFSFLQEQNSKLNHF